MPASRTPCAVVLVPLSRMASTIRAATCTLCQGLGSDSAPQGHGWYAEDWQQQCFKTQPMRQRFCGCNDNWGHKCCGQGLWGEVLSLSLEVSSRATLAWRDGLFFRDSKACKPASPNGMSRRMSSRISTLDELPNKARHSAPRSPVALRDSQIWRLLERSNLFDIYVNNPTIGEVQGQTMQTLGVHKTRNIVCLLHLLVCAEIETQCVQRCCSKCSINCTARSIFGHPDKSRSRV